MKTLKALSLSLLAAAACAGSASAQTVVHVTGSTAFRAPATAAMIDFLDSFGGAHTVYAGYTGANNGNNSGLLGANNVILANGTIGSGGTATIIIEAYWSGSLAGVVDLVAGNATGTQYLDPATLGSAAITQINSAATVSANAASATASVSGTFTGYGGGVSLTGSFVPSGFSNSSPDLAMSDSFKTTIKNELATADELTVPVGSFSTIAALANACGGSTVVNAGTTGAGHAGTVGTVGVVPFIWTAGNISTSTDIPTNIDMQTAKGLLSRGSVAQSQLTGGNTTADTTNYFYFTGRNEDSGTRIGYLAETQLGVTAPLVQYAVNSATSPGGAPTNAFQFPITALNTEPNIQWSTVGHSGYASGGNVKSVLGGAESNTPFTFSDGTQALGNTGASYFISALGVTDATGVTGGHLLSYGGVPFSVQAVQNGQYSFWCYEHAYRLNSLTGTPKTVVDGIADAIFSADADIKGDGIHQAIEGGFAAGILYNSNFKVSRAFTEGGVVLHN